MVASSLQQYLSGEKFKEISYFVYAALPPDEYEMLNMSLGFTCIPLPDLLADIRIAKFAD